MAIKSSEAATLSVFSKSFSVQLYTQLHTINFFLAPVVKDSSQLMHIERATDEEKIFDMVNSRLL